jgi:molecular chaperone DnaK (HSP70)
VAIERIIGIDFGTSTTVVRVKTYIEGEPEGSDLYVLPVKFDGQDTLPTLVFWDDVYQEYLIGYEAENMAGNGTGTLFRNFKMDLLSPDAQARENAASLTGRFFRHIYQAYSHEQDHFTPCDSVTTYVSYPAKWPKDVAAFMIDIASDAGFENVKGVDEPSAAIYTVLSQKAADLQKLGGNSLNVLIVDMGAGTTDLALCRYDLGENSVEIINTWPGADGGAYFGGREIDEALWSYVKGYIGSCGIPAIEDEIPYLPKSKAWKESSVSPALRKERPVTSCAFISSLFHHLGGQEKPFPPIDRSVLEEMLKGYLYQLPALVSDMMANTPGVAPEEVDLVILTGGHSQWYFADDMLSGMMSKYGTVDFPRIRRGDGIPTDAGQGAAGKDRWAHCGRCRGGSGRFRRRGAGAGPGGA